jgi:uncharacterized membrane protein
MSGSGILHDQLTLAAGTKLGTEMTPTRSLLFYTLTATVPIVVITATLLFTKLSGRALAFLSLAAAIVATVAFGRLIYEMTLDIAGFPDYKLPIWSVFYLVMYVISAFAFLFFGMHIGAPGRYFGGFNEGPKCAFLDALYLSLVDYIGAAPDASIKLKGQAARFLTVIQGVLSMFINVVIITKFVNSF